MLIAIDIGYSHTKILGEKRRSIFPSVVGEVQTTHFNLSGLNGDIQVGTDEGEWFIGKTALQQSKYQTRRQDREWIHTPEYRAMLLAGITEITNSSNVTVNLITGLPVNYFSDHTVLATELKGTHIVKRHGKNQRVTINDVTFIPQGIAAVLSEALDDYGNIKNNVIATGTVGLLDIGGHTVNVATFDELKAISKQTISVNLGMWNVLTDIEKRINGAFPGQDLHGHEIIEIVKTGQLRRGSKFYDVTEIINDVVKPFIRNIEGEMTTIWGNAIRLNSLLIAGGGANIVGKTLTERYDNAKIVSNPQWANAEGYLKFGIRQTKTR